MTDQRPLLRVRNLRTEFKSHRGTVRILDNVSFDVGQGRIVGLVGESGSGKSMTALSLMGLVPSPPATVSADSIMLDGVELTTLTKDQLRSKRGRDMSMVFQEPMTSFNPVITMAQQVGEPLQIHGNFSKRDVRDKVRQMFEMVGIPEAKARLDAYPHELSGGLRQRAMIAMGLICEPKLLIADEPTTALDVTTQAQILRLIMELRDRVGTAIIMITHDLGIIAEMCDEVNVMYAGQIIEQANVYDVFDRASHPYTRGLLASIPKANEKPDGTRLKSINGMVPNLARLPGGCRFNPRCSDAMSVCSFKAPDLNLLENGHKARCWLHDKAGASL
ncbi:ABC transporter ATP-binding protein [Brucella intermedia]|uniref:Oligopeptide/dipeptide ABC transporter, ATP-binding protein n=3 Tax=Brucella intermedia TaxID=94625 RepID=C4WPT7_9HYPH|nr:ABC transporter ATP-binding protein [Brucella intermedia]KAB2668567.1 ABC transporter ATP-binding protein [Ochrobactrum sp. LMG 5442]PJT24916.1 ABC transporter ATP-binding protein [Ochrobactrum sp. 30A/1000/2015]PJT40366.1 ABC transporter ATP-binding protein [Ochrobactrum sp. 27A/999/2015]PJT43000.1 ABC transporter ATP-binding protein [Ochrobactrum sp. 23A/997/2015]EEQ94280.1 oligopeptide/dipeptide ABC transporter, ATP-binding protein [Brucella intermedia LMG 3301]